MKGLRRSVNLFEAFRHEATDPETFYRFLAEDTVVDVGRYCQLSGSIILDVGGASGYVADAFREVGARAFTAEYDVDQTTEHGRQLVGGIMADGCALPIATGAVDVSYSSNVLEHVVSHEQMLSEMVRVVAPGGVIYLTFTNWLSPWGGPRDIALALSRWRVGGPTIRTSHWSSTKEQIRREPLFFEHRRSAPLVQFEPQRQCARCVSPVLSPLDQVDRKGSGTTERF